MKKQSLFSQLISSLLVLTLVVSLAPIPEVHAAPGDGGPVGESGVLPWATAGNAWQIADGLEKTHRQLVAASGGQEVALVWEHLSSQVEDPRLLQAAELLRKRGIQVSGELVTPKEMEERIANALIGKEGLAQALNVKLDPYTVKRSIGLFLSKVGNITFWNHVRNWARNDFGQSSLKAKFYKTGYATLASSLGAGWFLWAASMKGKENAFAAQMSESVSELLKSETGAGALEGAYGAITSSGHLSAGSMVAAGLLTAWIFGYQFVFTAVNSFRRQWVTPRFDPLSPDGDQLILGQERGYSRIFFFLASVGVEMVISTAMLTAFNGGHIDGTLMRTAALIAWGSFTTSVASSMAYMPSEALAGTYNQREVDAMTLLEERKAELKASGIKVDRLSTALQHGASANGLVAFSERFLWWELLYGPMRQSFMLGVTGFIGNLLQYSFLGFFGLGLAMDTRATRGSTGRKLANTGKGIWNYIHRFFGKAEDAPVDCADLLEFRAIKSELAQLGSNEPSALPSP